MSESWLNLEGKTVIVTGGASGIGKAVAQGFLNAGSNVVISDMASEAPELDEAAGKLLYVKTDVTKVADVEAMVEKTKETFGTIDVLVNNAGINILKIARTAIIAKTYIVIILIPSVCFFINDFFDLESHFCIRFAGMLRIYAIINAMKNGFTASKILAKYCVILLKLSKVLYTAITATQNTNAIIHP